MDSSPDLLNPYVESAEAFPEEVEGLMCIFGDKQIDSIDDWSLHTLMKMVSYQKRWASSGQNAVIRLPIDSMSHTATALAETSTYWVTNQISTQHIHLGTDLELARDAVDYLLTGAIPESE